MNSSAYIRLISTGIVFLFLGILGTGLAEAEPPTQAYNPCINPDDVIWSEHPDRAFPLDCFSDEIDPVGSGESGFPPLQQLIHALSRLLPIPPTGAVLLGGLEFSLSGESAWGSGAFRKPEQVRLAPVPRPREP